MSSKRPEAEPGGEAAGEGAGTGSGREGRAVLCGKCEHLSPWGRNECQYCGARLYVACNDCGERNERVRARCNKCGRHLHRTLASRARGVLRRNRRLLQPGYVLLFFLGAGVVLILIMLVSKLYFPPLP